MSSTTKPTKPSSFTSWRKRNRFHLQIAALAALLLSPFGLYGAILSGRGTVSSLFFVLITAGMAVMAWLG